jgi:hypothetical protein
VRVQEDVVVDFGFVLLSTVATGILDEIYSEI